MSWSRLVTLDCDGQPCWSGPYDSTTDDVETAREMAFQYAHWSYDPETDEDLCSKCTKIREGN